MSAGGELRESVALLASEWRLLALGLGGPLVYATWVVLTGLVLDIGTPALKRAVATTVAGTPIRGLELLALLGWVVFPSLVAIAAVQRQLFNRHDNLANYYRMAEPGVLLVVPSVALAACLVALVMTGWSLPLVVALLVATVHFLVRTAAFGYRVYTLSLPRTLLAMIGVSATSLVVGLLVRLPSVAARDPRLSSRVALAGVADGVQAWTTLLGVDQALLLRGTLFVPIVLSTCYLLAQTTVASVAKRRGLPTAPKRRPGQRVPESAQPSAATSDTRVVSGPETGQPDGMGDTVVADPDPTPTGESHSAPSAASTESNSAPSAATESESSEPAAENADHSGTRVFSPNDPVPSAGGDGSPADPLSDDTTAEDDSGSEEDPTESDRQEPARDDTESTPGSSTDTVEEQTVVGDDVSTDATAAESATADTNGSAPVYDPTGADPATHRPVVPTFEATVSDSDDERIEASGASDSRGPATAPVLPRFEPARATDRAGDDTGESVSRGHVLPQFEPAPTDEGAVERATRRHEDVVPVFEAAADPGSSTDESGSRAGDGDVVPRFDAAHDDGGPDDAPVSIAEQADTVIADRSDDATPVDAGGDEAVVDTDEDQSGADPETIGCPSCGRNVRNSADICYCPGCGTALER